MHNVKGDWAVLIAYSVNTLGLSSMAVYLVVTEHYAWAWIPFLLAASLSIRSKDHE